MAKLMTNNERPTPQMMESDLISLDLTTKLILIAVYIQGDNLMGCF